MKVNRIFLLVLCALLMQSCATYREKGNSTDRYFFTLAPSYNCNQEPKAINKEFDVVKLLGCIFGVSTEMDEVKIKADFEECERNNKVEVGDWDLVVSAETKVTECMSTKGWTICHVDGCRY